MLSESEKVTALESLGGWAFSFLDDQIATHDDALLASLVAEELSNLELALASEGISDYLDAKICGDENADLLLGKMWMPDFTEAQKIDWLRVFLSALVLEIGARRNGTSESRHMKT